PRGLSEQRRGPGGRLHDAAEDLEGRGLAGAVRADQTEDLARTHVEIDAADRLDGPVALGQRADLDRRSRLAHRRACRGHSSPSTRISPSAGMPGLAKPTAPRSRSLTPTTCFTRSSRKYVFSGVNDACGSTRRTYASTGLFGDESRNTRAGWLILTRPIWPSS